MKAQGTIIRLISGQQLNTHKNFYATKKALFIPIVGTEHVPFVASKIAQEINVGYSLINFHEFKRNSLYHDRVCLFFKVLTSYEFARFDDGYPVFNKCMYDKVFVLDAQQEVNYYFLLKVCSYKVLEELFGDQLLLKNFFIEINEDDEN